VAPVMMTVIFCLFMLLVAVVLLNALIAILGDSYDRVRERSKAEKIHAKLDLTVDLLAQTCWIPLTYRSLPKIYHYNDWKSWREAHWSGPLEFIGQKLPIESASDALKFVVWVLLVLLLYLVVLVMDVYHIVVGVPLVALHLIRRASPVLFVWSELDGIIPAVAMPVRVYEAEVDDTGDDEWDGQIKKIKNNTQAIARETREDIADLRKRIDNIVDLQINLQTTVSSMAAAIDRIAGPAPPPASADVY